MLSKFTRANHWVENTFGVDVANSKIERGLRLLEEAFELCQVLDVPPKQIKHLVDRVYNRPVGELQQELAGTNFVLWTLAHQLGYWSLTFITEEMIVDVEQMPKKHFQRKYEQKIEDRITFHTSDSFR